LSLWGSTVNEDSKVVKLALETRPVKTVYWSVGRQAALDEFKYADFPRCMYGGYYSLVPPYCYMLSASVLWESIMPMRLRHYSKAGWVDDIGSWKSYGPLPMKRHDEACWVQKFAKREDVDRITQNAESDLSPVDNPDVEKYRELVLPIVRANRNVQFVFLLSPVYLSELWYTGMNGSLRTQRALIDMFMSEPNAEFHDMVGLTQITHDIGRFRDNIHYDANGARLVVAALASGQQKIASISQHEKILRRELDASAAVVHSFFDETCP
jgi:hypothetical protein